MLSFNESLFFSDWDTWNHTQRYLKSVHNNPNLDQTHLILGLIMTANLLELPNPFAALYRQSVQWTEHRGDVISVIHVAEEAYSSILY